MRIQDDFGDIPKSLQLDLLLKFENLSIMAMSKTEKRNAAKKNAVAQSKAKKAARDARISQQAGGPKKKGKKSLSTKRK